jgi:hypothetical protein
MNEEDYPIREIRRFDTIFNVCSYFYQNKPAAIH